MSEVPISEATSLFLGKTITKMDTSCDNNIEFLFTDGTRVALHIDVDSQFGLPVVLVCTHCAEIS